MDSFQWNIFRERKYRALVLPLYRVTHKTSETIIRNLHCYVSFIHNFITGFALCQTFNNASKNMTITRLIYVFCLRYSNLMAYLIIWQLNKQVYSCRESWIIETERINSLESYPRSHSLWVTLFLRVSGCIYSLILCG